jgi:hypothetical protein
MVGKIIEIPIKPSFTCSGHVCLTQPEKFESHNVKSAICILSIPLQLLCARLGNPMGEEKGGYKIIVEIEDNI